MIAWWCGCQLRMLVESELRRHVVLLLALWLGALASDHRLLEGEVRAVAFVVELSLLVGHGALLILGLAAGADRRM